MSGKGIARSIKNYAKGFSDVQIKVREATSNDAWGPSGTLMNEIAQATYNQQDFVEVMDMIDRRLNDKGKNWRHVFKALLLLDYCVHVGSENVVLYAKENLYVVKTLKEFQHIDDSGKDVGSNVRQKAKDITSLLLDDVRLKEERHKRTQMRDRMAAVGDYMNETILDGRHANGDNMYERPGYLDEDGDLRKAIEESKRLAQEELKNRNKGDEDLAKALQLSEQEAKEKEEKRRAQLERENQQNLFGTGGNDGQTFQNFPQNQVFGAASNPYNQQQFQQQQQWPQNTGMTGMSFSNPISTQQPMYNQQTGLGNPYQQQQQQQGFPQSLQAQMTGMPQSLQAQMTGMPQQFTGMAPFQTNHSMTTPPPQQQQPQFTGMPAFQTSTVTGTNPFGQQQNNTQSQSMPNLQPQQTGFSTATSSLGQSPSTSVFGTVSTPQTQPSQLSVSSSPAQAKPEDPRYAKLNSLLGNRDDGMDTFGNVGNLRVPFGTGYASTIKPDSQQIGSSPNLQSTNIGGTSSNNNSNNNSNTSDSPSFSQSFGQQPSRNPFGAGNSSPSPASNGRSLLEMMADQKVQQQHQSNQAFQAQQLQPQMTGFQQQPQATGFQQQQPQMTGFQQPQMTGFQQPQVTGFNQTNGFQQQQQQPAFGQQNGSFF